MCDCASDMQSILFPPQSTSHYAILINRIGNVLSASNLAWI